MSVRTRFAPSPTGSLHLGNLRVAVFNHLFARKHGGAFVLRIEDTDLERHDEGAVGRILDDLRWLGLDWDEGPDVGGPWGPYRQSLRGERYREAALGLEREGRVYPCFCSEDEGTREGRMGGGCPGGCRELDAAEVERRLGAGERRALRFPVPQEGISIVDEVRGAINLDGRDIADFIILRADGRATYNFAVVVDDVEMRISHVIRGAGHLSNTPKQALLFDALGASRPAFVHLPTVLAPEGGKLSKRRGAPGADQLRARGFHPDGVVNYLSLLGWSPGDDREVLDRSELEASLDLARVGASDTQYDPEKLEWMSGQHIARMPLPELADAVRPFVDRTRFPLDEEALPVAVEAIRTRLATFGAVNEHLALVLPGTDELRRGQGELEGDQEAEPVLEAVREELESLGEWSPDAIGSAVRSAGRRIGASGRRLFRPVRLAVTGMESGPDLGHVMAVQGRDAVLERLGQALDRCRSSSGRRQPEGGSGPGDCDD